MSTKDQPDSASGLLGADEVLRRLALRPEQLKAMVDAGELQVVRRDGESWYMASQVQRLSAAPAGGSAEDDPQRTLPEPAPVGGDESTQRTLDYVPESAPGDDATARTLDYTPESSSEDDATARTLDYHGPEGDAPEAQRTLEYESHSTPATLPGAAQVRVGGYDPDRTLEEVWGATLQAAGNVAPDVTLKSPDQQQATIVEEPPRGGSSTEPTMLLDQDPSQSSSRLDLLISGLPLSEVVASGDTNETLSFEDLGSDGTRATHALPAGGATMRAGAAGGNAEFLLVRHLASGGMGDVYEARQSGLDRVVAFKIPKMQSQADRRMLAQFVREAAVTGDLEHPNIVPIYKSGSSGGGKPFYAMKRVHGIEWHHLLHPDRHAQQCRDAAKAAEVQSRADGMGLNEHLEILIKVCDAIAFAHSRGIVHRDLKPENVMIGGYGEVLVMDWGLAVDFTDGDPSQAKAAHVSTINGPAGTPAYLAPEMAFGDPEKIGRHSDIFLLGAILYEILTGTAPHRGDSLMAVIAVAASGEVQPPQERAPDRDIPEGLADIAMTAMAAEPEDRFASVEDLQQALRDYQQHAQSLKISREADQELARLRTTRGGGSTVYARYAEVVAAYRQALNLWDGNVAAANGLLRALEGFVDTALKYEDLGLAKAQIDELAKAPGHDEVRLADFRKRHARLDAAHRRRRRNFRLMAGAAVLMLATMIGGGAYYTSALAEQRDKAQQALLTAEQERQNAIDARTIAETERQKAEAAKEKIEQQQDEIVAAKERAVQQRDAAQKAQREAEAERRRAEEQKQIAEDERQKAEAQRQEAERQRAEAQRQEQLAKASIARVFIDRAETRLSGDHDYGVAALNLVQALQQDRSAESARTLLARVLQIAPTLGAAAPIPGKAQHLALSADHQRVAVATGDGKLQVMPVDGLKTTDESIALPGKAWDLAAAGDDWLVALQDGSVQRIDGAGNLSPLPFSFDAPATALSVRNQQIAVGARDGRVAVLGRGAQPLVFQAHWGGIPALRFADDDTLVTGSWDGRLRVWKLSDGASPERAADLTGHSDFVYSIDVSDDGRLAVSAGHDGTIRLWDIERGTEMQTFKGHDGPVGAVTFLRANGDFASQAWDGTVRLWSAETGALTATLRVDAVEGLGLSAAGERRLLCLAENGGLKAWDISASLKRAEQGLQGRLPAALCLGADGNRAVVAAGHGVMIAALDAPAEEAAAVDLSSRTLTAHDDGTGIRAVLTSGEMVRVRDGVVAQKQQLPFEPQAAVFSIGGEFLALAGDGRLLVVRSDDGGATDIQAPLPRSARALAVAEQGDVAAAVVGSQRVVLATADGLKRIEMPSGAGLQAVALSADGKLLVVGGDDRLIRLYDIETAALKVVLSGHSKGVTSLALMRDSETLVSGGRDRTVRLWDLDMNSTWMTLGIPEGWVTALAVSADDAHFAAASERGMLHVWSMPTKTATLGGNLMDLVAQHFGVRLNANGKTETVPPGQVSRQRTVMR